MTTSIWLLVSAVVLVVIAGILYLFRLFNALQIFILRTIGNWFSFHEALESTKLDEDMLRIMLEVLVKKNFLICRIDEEELRKTCENIMSSTDYQEFAELDEEEKANYLKLAANEMRNELTFSTENAHMFCYKVTRRYPTRRSFNKAWKKATAWTANALGPS